MGLFTKLFGKKNEPAQNAGEHAVIVHFAYGQTDLGPMFALEDELEKAIEAAGAGEFDGNEIAVDGGDGYFYMYGPDGDRLFAAVRPVLEKAACLSGVTAAIRYGPPADGVEERKVVICSTHA